mmetsp:Transcript_2460/g.6510  ORF Transcript_2460/g.6510 Transcript_2460/m.6510 type:complete len:268 (+) Transcript_2460:217-1020(+)
MCVQTSSSEPNTPGSSSSALGCGVTWQRWLRKASTSIKDSSIHTSRTVSSRLPVKGRSDRCCCTRRVKTPFRLETWWSWTTRVTARSSCAQLSSRALLPSTGGFVVDNAACVGMEDGGGFTVLLINELREPPSKPSETTCRHVASSSSESRVGLSLLGQAIVTSDLSTSTIAGRIIACISAWLWGSPTLLGWWSWGVCCCCCCRHRARNWSKCALDKSVRPVMDASLRSFWMTARHRHCASGDLTNLRRFSPVLTNSFCLSPCTQAS